MIKKMLFMSFLILSCGEKIYSQWFLLNSQTSADLNSIDIINTSTGYAVGSAGLIIRTTNGGMNWNVLNSQTSQNLNSVYFYAATTGVVCGNGGVILLTTNSGNNWNAVTSGVTDNLYSVSFGIGIFKGVCCGSSGTLLYTTNGGNDWTVAKSGFLSTFYCNDIAELTAAYAGGVNTIFQPLLARSFNGGASWDYTAFYLNGNEGSIRDLYFKSTSAGYAVSKIWDGQGAISHTSDNGLTWSTQLYTHALNALDFANSNTAYAVGYNGYILKSTDGGSSWASQSAPVTAVLKSVDFVDSLNGYVCGLSGTLIKTTNGGMTFISGGENHIPHSFRLFQNHPNPFNPATVISYELNFRSDVTLKIFNILGKEVVKLVSGVQAAGSYSYTWNASEFDSGVYCCMLNVNGEFQSMRLVLTK